MYPLIYVLDWKQEKGDRQSYVERDSSYAFGEQYRTYYKGIEHDLGSYSQDTVLSVFKQGQSNTSSFGLGCYSTRKPKSMLDWTNS